MQSSTKALRRPRDGIADNLTGFTTPDARHHGLAGRAASGTEFPAGFPSSHTGFVSLHGAGKKIPAASGMIDQSFGWFGV